MKLALGLSFILLSTLAGYAFQEGSQICLPEHHAAEQENKVYCHCVAMGGYMNCDADTGHYSHYKWQEENDRRAKDLDPKTKKPKEKPVPKCGMDCKEDNCECCAYMARFQKKAALTIPYDNY